MDGQKGKEVVFRIRRYDPAHEAKPRMEEYRISYDPGMTVLDGLWKIKETLSPTLSWRYSCRMGICGSCGMMINGSPRLACNTQVSELDASVVAVAPLPNFDIIRDLVPDLRPMFDLHTKLRPFIVREDVEEQEHPTGEFTQTKEELESYLQFSFCIKCGCCMAACPTVASDPEYYGPMPLAQAHRYNADSRDGGFSTRKKELVQDPGPWRCHFAGECSKVCPKGVDPAKAIQLMKRSLVLDYLHLRRKPCPAKLAEVPKDLQRRPDIPEAPKKTV
jgi:succinate dehydrogenase / fumarate reductase, iron-sulfur subunit